MNRTCAAEGCDNPVPPRQGRYGRHPIYCSPACRKIPPARSRLRVEIGHEAAENAQPIGRVFTVSLVRSDAKVTVAHGLGRLSAEHLVGQIEALLSNSRAKGGTIG